MPAPRPRTSPRPEPRRDRPAETASSTRSQTQHDWRARTLSPARSARPAAGRASRGRNNQRGRPLDSGRLTAQIEQSILAFIRAGAFDYVAAEAAGVGDRTFREWMARGEGRHPTRRPTKRLQGFARAVRQARAQARVAKEIEVAKVDPRFWLSHQGRSRPGRDGWTDPVAGEESSEASSAVLPLAETVQAIQTLVDAGAVAPLQCSCGHRCEPEQNR